MAERPLLDPSLYLVTDPDAGSDLLAVVERALAGGVTLVQLRDKLADGGALLATARALAALLAPRGIPLLVNDRVDVAAAAGVGCHLGQTDLPPAFAREILGEEAIIGLSLDRPEQAELADPALLDYVAYGPFAATATKLDAGAAIGPDGIRAVRARTALPLVAIGGIDAGNAGQAIAAGADGVAVVRAIMAAGDPEGAARALADAVAAARPVLAEATFAEGGR